MSMWKKILVNLGGLAGIIISLFVAPPEAPLWLWAVLSAAVLAVLNYVCFGWRTANNGSKSGAKSTVVIVLGVVVLLVDLIFRYLYG